MRNGLNGHAKILLGHVWGRRMIGSNAQQSCGKTIKFSPGSFNPLPVRFLWTKLPTV